MDLNEISVFVKVAGAGSFTQAARQLGIPNSTASAKVAALERRLGVRLLYRTARKLRLTDEGATYFRQASQGLADLQRAESEISSSQRCLQFTALGHDSWRFTDGERSVTVPITRQVVANGIDFLKALVASGSGIALLPAYACHVEMRTGDLERILPDWRSRADPVHLVYAGGRFMAPRVRAFVDMAFGAPQNMFRA